MNPFIILAVIVAILFGILIWFVAPDNTGVAFIIVGGFVAAFAISFLISSTLVYILCWAFNWTFTWKLAVGVYAIVLIARIIISAARNGGSK